MKKIELQITQKEAGRDVTKRLKIDQDRSIGIGKAHGNTIRLKQGYFKDYEGAIVFMEGHLQYESLSDSKRKVFTKGRLIEVIKPIRVPFFIDDEIIITEKPDKYRELGVVVKRVA